MLESKKKYLRWETLLGREQVSVKTDRNKHRLEIWRFLTAKFCLLLGASKILRTIKIEISTLLRDLMTGIAGNWFQSSKNFLLWVFCESDEGKIYPAVCWRQSSVRPPAFISKSRFTRETYKYSRVWISYLWKGDFCFKFVFCIWQRRRWRPVPCTCAVIPLSLGFWEGKRETLI